MSAGPQADRSYPTFAPEPVFGTCLYCREAPGVGGDTLWANQMLAFDALSPGMQRRLEKMNVMHRAKRSHGPQGAYADDDLKSMRIEVGEAGTREQAHPCSACIRKTAAGSSSSTECIRSASAGGAARSRRRTTAPPGAPRSTTARVTGA